MSGVRVPHRPPFLLRKNGERSRKASLHAAPAALHSKPKVFFTSSQIPASLACEVVSLRCRFIALVKRSALLPVKLPPIGGWMCYFYSAALPLNFSTSKPIAAEHSSNGIFNFFLQIFLVIENLSKICNPQLQTPAGDVILPVRWLVRVWRK